MGSTTSGRLIASPLVLQPVKSPKPTFLAPTAPKTLTLICRAENRSTTTTVKKPHEKDGSHRPTRRNPRKSSYGASRRSILKKTFIQEQVMFTGPLSDHPTVAIIGGGMSGLVCALNLEKRRIRSTVFDTENIPTSTAEKVKAAMLDGVESALGQSKGSLKKPFYTRLQLWGAALPTNTPSVPFIFDPHGRAGICGDWLLGSSLEAAALSGIALANHIADYFQSSGAHPDEFAVGLHNEFQPIRGHDIGQFPALESIEQTVGSQAIQL